MHHKERKLDKKPAMGCKGHPLRHLGRRRNVTAELALHLFWCVLARDLPVRGMVSELLQVKVWIKGELPTGTQPASVAVCPVKWSLATCCTLSAVNSQTELTDLQQALPPGLIQTLRAVSCGVQRVLSRAVLRVLRVLCG